MVDLGPRDPSSRDGELPNVCNCMWRNYPINSFVVHVIDRSFPEDVSRDSCASASGPQLGLFLGIIFLWFSLNLGLSFGSAYAEVNSAYIYKDI